MTRYSRSRPPDRSLVQLLAVVQVLTACIVVYAVWVQASRGQWLIMLLLLCAVMQQLVLAWRNWRGWTP